VEKTVREIRRATRRHHSAEEKIRIVLEGLRGENSIAELCRKEGNQSEPLLSLVEGEAGKKRLAGDTAHVWRRVEASKASYISDEYALAGRTILAKYIITAAKARRA
jgi:transposase